MSNKSNYSLETYAVGGASKGDENTGAISFPLYLSATFKHQGLNQSTGYDYSRLQNPTTEEAEKTIALLENGKEAMAFSCGMAALTASGAVSTDSVELVAVEPSRASPGQK